MVNEYQCETITNYGCGVEDAFLQGRNRSGIARICYPENKLFITREQYGVKHANYKVAPNNPQDSVTHCI